MTEVLRTDVLCIPKRRRLVHSKTKEENGQDVLHIFYGEKEIVFDEPDLLPFAHKLLELERFAAADAMSWADGEPYSWEKVQELLDALLEQDILKRVADVPVAAGTQAFPPTLGIAPEGRVPRTFSAKKDECPSITEEAFGRPIDLSNLEAVIPVYRIAHPTLDQEGRQVGENNAAPKNLFLDLPTQRRVCPYSGHRYQAEQPMNVTALKNMTARWPELLSLTAQSREAFLARLPQRDPWLRAGELQLLAVCSLASVGYVMVRGVDPVANGELDAGLAAMFRLIDGVRIVTTEMLRDTASAHGCDRPVSAQIVSEYAETHMLYNGLHGVCAGPQGLIDEYLRVLLGEATPPDPVEPDLATRLGDQSAALDYALLGQRMEALIRTFGSLQGRLHEALRVSFLEHTPRGTFEELLDAPIDDSHYPQFRDDHPLLQTIELELGVSRWIFERAGAGLSLGTRVTRETTDEIFRLDPAVQADARGKVADFLSRALPDHPSAKGAMRDGLSSIVADALTLERRCLRAVSGEQRKLNERLRRTSARPLTGADLALYTRPRNGPPLAETLARGLGVSVVTSAEVSVLSHGTHSQTLTD